MRLSNFHLMLRRVVVLTMTMCVFMCSSIAATPVRSEKKYAVIIGINKYERADITPLSCAVSDAHMFANVLRALHYDKVYEMTSDLPRDSDDYPTSNNIGFRLGNIRAIMDDADATSKTFVFFYSGHGMELKEESKRNGDTYLVSVDTDIRNDEVLKRSAYRFADIKEIVYNMKAKNVLIVFDACRNDPHGGGRSTSDNRLSETAARDLTLTAASKDGQSAEPATVATLFACSPTQRSYEWVKRGHGYFTYFLVEGLKGKAMARDSNTVTLGSLYEYCRNAVKREAQDAGYKQVPWLSLDGSPDWVVATASDAAAVARVHDASTPTHHDHTTTGRPQEEARPTLASREAPPFVSVTSPSKDFRTTRDNVVLAATVTGGGHLSDVTVSVNGRAVPLGRGLKRGANGALVQTTVSVDVGVNTIVVSAMSASGQPGQATVSVVRKAPAKESPGAVASHAIKPSATHPFSAVGPSRIVTPASTFTVRGFAGAWDGRATVNGSHVVLHRSAQADGHFTQEITWPNGDVEHLNGQMAIAGSTYTTTYDDGSSDSGQIQVYPEGTVEMYSNRMKAAVFWVRTP